MQGVQGRAAKRWAREESEVKGSHNGAGSACAAQGSGTSCPGCLQDSGAGQQEAAAAAAGGSHPPADSYWRRMRDRRADLTSLLPEPLPEAAADARRGSRPRFAVGHLGARPRWWPSSCCIATFATCAVVGCCGRGLREVLADGRRWAGRWASRGSLWACTWFRAANCDMHAMYAGAMVAIWLCR